MCSHYSCVTTMNIRSKAVNNAVSPPTEEREKTKKRKRSNPQKGEDQSKKVKKQEQTGPGLPPGEWLQQDKGDSHVWVSRRGGAHLSVPSKINRRNLSQILNDYLRWLSCLINFDQNYKLYFQSEGQDKRAGGEYLQWGDWGAALPASSQAPQPGGSESEEREVPCCHDQQDLAVWRESRSQSGELFSLSSQDVSSEHVVIVGPARTSKPMEEKEPWRKLASRQRASTWSRGREFFLLSWSRMFLQNIENNNKSQFQ